MLIGLSIRDVVLIESLDLAIGPGLTALTGETGAGKSIILDALGLATGARADAGLVRRGATGQASATAIFALTADHPVFAYLDDKGLDYGRDEDLVLRRQLSADGRSRAFVNDQATSVGVLKDLGAMLLEVHGQHETVGLLDPRTHRTLLDAFGSVAVSAVASAWSGWRAAREKAEALRQLADHAAAETEELTLRLSELDRLDPREGEETALAEERALLGSAEKALADIASAQDALGGDALSGKLAQAYRALERARERALHAGAPADGVAMTRLTAACDSVDRALVEAQEASAAIDAVADSFEFEPDRLEKTEERLFALRAMARKLNVAVETLPSLRAEFAARLQAIETSGEALKAAEEEAASARDGYIFAAQALTAERRAAGDRLAKAVEAELAPLKLEKARFRVAVEALPEDRAGPTGVDRVAFEISTNPGAPFGPMEAIASGGELARFALALKAALAGKGGGPQPLMIFDEVDQGVGGAVADAVGLRLKRLAENAQVLVVTHSAQVAARGDAHWRIAKSGDDQAIRTRVEPLSPAQRQEEIARMLSGAEVTEAARAAAKALIG
ncbi:MULTISPECIES: DNA repair protein RecN [unclassified Caulobacter]|uniref:DNA repair protein RecN n=1 Tax=unclassified Caulobacter TaxID=2648921 RepID=UPI000D3A5594|nr:MULTISPECIES: DNA repair protein RecN [unclassified Caulobacter]PTS91751.1 DNA repair protein RecN [Caulobacter sp. HMWF009]PTT05786.1 DNA repair protein RecN [Caulobacter sp. HMWF025]